MDRPRTIPGPSPASVLDPDLCSCSISGLGYLLRQDLDDDAAVLRAARLGLVRRDRLLFAVADHVNLVQRDLLRLIQVALHRFGAVEADLVVRVLGADVVGVPFDLDEAAVGVGLQLLTSSSICVCMSAGIFVWPNLKPPLSSLITTS